uniref:Uncharacterized protein n=1 Tax=Oryza sativa subsp. japonica TaxID=39947 RepID=Q8GS70_ORYSJ|nr:hypothetical protein [Oryza sativa Japonica Group]AAN16329.1 hypothetical protein [Oryza sativa Japonica Group]
MILGISSTFSPLESLAKSFWKALDSSLSRIRSSRSFLPRRRPPWAFATAEDRRSIAVTVDPKVAAASSSSPSSSVVLPPPFWSPIPSFPESPFSPEKSLKSSKASKASHTDPKQPFEHVDPI